jgi:hypothetical protein
LGNAILLADTSEVKFQGDMDNNGVVDTMHFYIGPVSEMTGTLNPSDRIIYRRRNSTSPLDFGHGVTQFFVTYYDGNGNTTATLSDIRTLKIRLVVQGEQEINRYYPTSIWESFILPSNI